LSETIDDNPAVGDNIATVRLTAPGEAAADFGMFNYMSVVAGITSEHAAEDATEVTGNFGGGHIGLATPEADIGDIPAERVAHYSGDFVGIYVESGDSDEGFVAVATGVAAFTADFDEMDVTGGVFSINIVGTDLDGGEGSGVAGDILFDDVTIAGNTFTGGVVPGDGGFAEFADTTGTLDGTFYGPVSDLEDDLHMGPVEAGVVLTLIDGGSDDFITGVIGATIDTINFDN